MKRFAINGLIVLSILANSGISLAANSESLTEQQRICRGEFSPANIAQAVEKCEEEDLARATVAMYELDRQLTDFNKTLIEAEEYLKSEEYKKDKKIVEVITYTGASAVLVGAVGLLVEMATEIKGNPTMSKKVGTAFFVSLAIGCLMIGYPEGSPEMWHKIKFHPEDIPLLKQQIEKVKEDLKIRRVLLDAASKIKQAQKEQKNS